MEPGSFLDELTEIAGEYVRQGGVLAFVKTNLGPEIPIYSGTPTGERGLLDALGIQAALIIRNRDGRVLASYGDPPATNPFLVTAFAIGATVAVLVAVKVIRKF